MAEQVPEKEIVIYDGACPTHDILRSASVDRTRGEFPDAVIIAHPECRQDVVEIADEVCSTTGMLDAVAKYPNVKTFIIATENGWNLYVCGNGGMKPRHADLFATGLDKETLIKYIDRFLSFYVRTADRLQRTSVWMENMEGGLDYLSACFKSIKISFPTVRASS